MKHDLDHFLKESNRAVPHLSAAEKRAWAEHCLETHPGMTEHHLTAHQAMPAPAAASLPLAPPRCEASPRWMAWAVIALLGWIAACCLVGLARADESLPPESHPPAAAPEHPKPVAAEDREKFKDLRIKAYEALAHKIDAERRAEKARKEAAEAELESGATEKQLDEINAKIGAIVAEWRGRYQAPESGWCITSTFDWTKKGDKPCAGW